MTTKRSKPVSNDSAFTLIELLVVIAIIAILAAILFPVFATAREKSRQTSCASNMKQMGIGFIQYSQDFDEMMPITSMYALPSYAYVSSWDKCIQPYIGVKVSSGGGTNSTVFGCPDDATNHGATSGRSYAMPAPQYNTGMGGVYGGCGSVAAAPNYGCLAISQVPVPSTTFMLVEFPSANNFLGNNSNAFVKGPITISATGSACSSGAAEVPGQDYYLLGSPAGSSYPTANAGLASHSSGWNYLYGDGHIKWLLPMMSFGLVQTKFGPAGCWPAGPWTIQDGD